MSERLLSEEGPAREEGEPLTQEVSVRPPRRLTTETVVTGKTLWEGVDPSLQTTLSTVVELVGTPVSTLIRRKETEVAKELS